ncbi:MAG TPA: EfeM/EfeO family lipoprotein [Polyangia bacterium]|nr:EfeM/EfeO family lipoprotein [Polyangia bacterium]
MTSRPSILAGLTLSLSVASGAGCSSTKTDAEYQQDVVNGMRSGLIADLANLETASQMLQAAAPTPADRGWDATMDADAIANMKAAWTQCRTAYEHIEGATAPIFPDIDASIDSRYDDFLAALPGGDTYLFDGTGVTGMHAVERILYADVTPARVVQYESMLDGDVAAAFPATAQEASDFKTSLMQKQYDDAKMLHDAWEAATNYDLDAAFSGLISLMNEQREKVDKASTDQEESRYSQTTMADIRHNLEGTQKVYALFQPWIRSKNGGVAIDASIEQGFANLQTLYDTVQGDAIPQPPATWSSENPTPEDLQSPFGMLYEGVEAAVDPNEPSSIVAHMNQAATLLKFQGFTEE